MAYSRVSYIGDGSNKIFTVPFPYISSDHVEVRVGGVLKVVTLDYTWLTSSTIQITVAPALGKQVLLLRNTPKQSRLVNYQDAAILREVDLDLDSDQSFYIAQESLDAVQNIQETEVFFSGTDFTPGVTTSLTINGINATTSSVTVLFDAGAQQITEFSTSGGVVTFTEPIPVGVSQVQISYVVPTTLAIPDNSISTQKIINQAVTQEKLGPNVSGNGPTFSAIPISTQALVSNTWTKINLGTEEFDTNDNFGNSRFTPSVAGYYQINHSLFVSMTTASQAASQIYKNGINFAKGMQSTQTGTDLINVCLTGSHLIYMNGTTDYLELYGFVQGTSIVANNIASISNTRLSGFLARAA